MIFYANAPCGCCTEELSFVSEERAAEVFGALPLGSSVVVTDDNGERFSVDTFYGYWKEEGAGGTLTHLIERLNG